MGPPRSGNRERSESAPHVRAMLFCAMLEAATQAVDAHFPTRPPLTSANRLRAIWKGRASLFPFFYRRRERERRTLSDPPSASEAEASSVSQTAFEFLDERRRQMGVHDLFGGDDFLELAVEVEGRPTHPLRLQNVIADATISPELAPQFEGSAQGAVVLGFPLRSIGEPVRLSRRETEGANGQVELCGPSPRPRTDPPPSPAAEGLRCRREADPVVRGTRSAPHRVVV